MEDVADLSSSSVFRHTAERAFEMEQTPEDGIGEETEHGQGLVAMAQRVQEERHGVVLMSKTRDSLMELATSTRMGVNDVASVTNSDFRECLEDLNAAHEGAFTPMERRRFDKWASGEQAAGPTRTAILEAMETDEGGGVAAAGFNTNVSNTLKARIAAAALSDYEYMRTDAAALDACVTICAAQGLEPAKVVALSASLELGQRVCANDVIGIGAFKSDSRNLPVVKAVAKYNPNTLTKIVERGEIRDLVAHLTDLARDFASAGESTQAVLVSSFLAEAQVCFMHDTKGIFRYMKNYLRVYPGQGIPVVFDDRMATRARNESRDTTPTLSKIEITQLLRLEMAGEMAELRRQVGRGRGGETRPTTAPLSGEQAAAKLAKVKCFKCQAKGHFARDCPNEKTEVIDLTE